MRVVTYILLALILLLQYPLWFGKGSWLKVWDNNRQLEAQKSVNEQTRQRNAVLDAEVRDLKRGTEALEERARSELGMVKQGEVFFQVVGEGGATASAVTAATPPKGILSNHRWLITSGACLQFRDAQCDLDQFFQCLLSVQMMQRDIRLKRLQIHTQCCSFCSCTG